ncbi:MAG: hypothetical protein KAJ75_04280 [Alphaproteobacteria bacterium]|nr:hypothetical protein [Alphaproteobacteria bacterium]
MAVGNPSSETANLYDELTHLPYSAHSKIEQIEQKLHQIVKLNPKDICSRIALLQSFSMTAKLDDAIEQAEIIWKQSAHLPPLVEQSYISALIDIGLFSWASSLVPHKLNERGGLGRKGYFPISLASAIGSGNVELMARIAKHEEADNNAEKLEFIVKQMNEYDLAVHFKNQQAIINELSLGHQAAYEVVLDRRKNWPFIDIGIFIKGDSLEIYRLQSAIDRAVKEYYKSAGIQPPRNCRTRIFDINAHLPPDGSKPTES